MASGESGSEPFTFNFFASATLVKQSPQQQQHQQRQHPHPAGSNSGSDGDEHEKAAAEAQEAAAAEAQADALLAAAAGGAGEGPVDWHYTQVAEELELTSWQETQSKLTPSCSDVELPGSDIKLAKCSVSSDAAAKLLGDAQLQQSDLVPGKYEGGFKLWEGAVDLAAYLAREHGLTAEAVTARELQSSSGLQGLRVLELGCGHGLPGVLCLLAGAEVHFQDYNAEVLAQLTAPNVAANLAQLPAGVVRPRARYFAGDWLAVGSLLSSKGLDASYDLILTAETIYNLRGANRLLECIKQVLRPPHGIALVAAKSHYFGVGGGTASFAAAVAADGTLEVARVWVMEDGASNKREILQLSFPASIAPYFM